MADCTHDPDNDPLVPIINAIDGSEGAVQQCAICGEGYVHLKEPLEYISIEFTLGEADEDIGTV